jgi:formylglycine-generating enzyme required for sulfatase activity
MKIIKGSSRIRRGGSWDYYDDVCTVSFRDYYYPFFRYYGMGFRITIGGGM